MPVVDYRTGHSRAALPADAIGPLQNLALPETPFRRWLFLGLSLAIAAGFLFTILHYWVPVHPGVDQNGYLFGGRQLAQTGTMKYAPIDPATGQFDPHQFVGRMWVGADYAKPTERFYPKYPIGLPLLVAIALKVGGPTYGPWLTYLINPVAMTLAVFGSYLLLRTFCGSFLAMLGQLIFASSPVTMLLAIDSNSHATAVCCVTWGMIGLMAWWKRATPWVALTAGLLLGYAAIIRYSEATMLAPIVLVIVFRLGLTHKWWRVPWYAIQAGWTKIAGDERATPDDQAAVSSGEIFRSMFRPLRDWLGAALLLVGWLIPVAGLVAYNLVAIGTYTGYDPTNESKPGQSFTVEHFLENWETMLRHLGNNGLFFIFPIAIIGLTWMFSWRHRVALVIAAWILPCLACYTLYYWAPDGTNIGYLRFFLTIFPGLTLCAMWVLGHLTNLMTQHARSWPGKFAAAMVVPVAVLLSLAVHLWNNTRDLESTQYSRLVLKRNADQILHVIPERAVIFGGDHSMFHHLQFMQNYSLYDLNTYREASNKNLLNNVDPDDPQGLDPGRSKSLFERLKDYDQKALDERQRNTVLASLNAGRRVFVIENAGSRRRDRQPRAISDLVRKLTAKPANTAEALYSDVIARWRFNLLAKAMTEGRDDKVKSKPRQKIRPMTPIVYEQPFLIYEITRQPLPVSPEKQAVLDYEAEQKAVADKAAAEKAAADKARQDAEAQRAELQKQRQEAERVRVETERKNQLAARQAQEAAQREVESRLAAARAALDKSTADRAILDKQIADLRAALPGLQEKTATENGAIQRAIADRMTIEQSLTGLRTQADQLAGSIASQQKEVAAIAATLDVRRRELATTEQKLATAKSEISRLATVKPEPSTQPSTTQP